jgi:hypothetical protein
MKTSTFVFLFTIVLFTSCNNIFNPTIKGNGKIVTKTIQIVDVTQIENTGTFNIFIKQGEPEVARIETDENILEFVSANITAHRCSFQTKENLNLNATKSNIYITLKSLSHIKNEGVGNVILTGIKINNLLEIENSGIGDCNLNGTIAQELKIENNGVGNLILNGKANKLYINNSGVGSIDAFSFLADTVELDNNGVGSVDVFASKLISISSNGTGSVRYKGTAVKGKLNKNGVGSVEKME